ncbi:MAG: hypothetical protein ACI9SE_004306, partial [Neolewinella sp.]
CERGALGVFAAVDILPVPISNGTTFWLDQDLTAATPLTRPMRVFK